MPAAIKKDCAGSPIRADLQDFVDAARQLGDEALRLEHVVEQQIEVDVAGADHDERFFLSLLAHLSLPYQVDGDIASAAGAGSGREPPSPAPPAQRAGWHARFPSAALCTSSLPLQILLQQRSEERRVGKAGVSTCRSRWSPYN